VQPRPYLEVIIFTRLVNPFCNCRSIGSDCSRAQPKKLNWNFSRLMDASLPSITTGQSEPTATIAPLVMVDDRWTGKHFSLGSTSLANHAG
jgi:hypothetical protein